ncbi:MAG: hypothetical protein KAR21_21540, partial [Spirochaetales bacterium]|nr:hypothetical protein [Spirochaetales bacterium]
FYSDLRAKWLNNGYTILTAQAQFILLWKDKEEDKEYRIVLPNLRLKKELSLVNQQPLNVLCLIYYTI